MEIDYSMREKVAIEKTKQLQGTMTQDSFDFQKQK
jgi:hypothetical protein